MNMVCCIHMFMHVSIGNWFCNSCGSMFSRKYVYTSLFKGVSEKYNPIMYDHSRCHTRHLETMGVQKEQFVSNKDFLLFDACCACSLVYYY